MELVSQITIRMLIVSLLLLIIAAATTGMAKDDGGLCGMTQDELFGCKPAVAAATAGPRPPTAACCTALGHADLTCFCTFKNNKYLPLLGIINATRAMQLPSKCDPNVSAHC